MLNDQAKGHTRVAELLQGKNAHGPGASLDSDAQINATYDGDGTASGGSRRTHVSHV